MGYLLKGKIAFIASVADDQSYGWGIAKQLAEQGCTILVGTWTPLLKIFQTSWERGKFDDSRKLADGSLLEFAKIYPLDAAYDTMNDVPEEVKHSKRYADYDGYAIEEVANQVENDFGKIDILVHSLANGPEVTKPLLETSRSGYLAAISASSYSFVSLVQHFAPIMKVGGSFITISYIASEKAIPGYGGGMNAAKAALESDTRLLAFEAGRKWKVRVNAISAGPLRSRAAKAIGFIDKMIDYAEANTPLKMSVEAEDVGDAVVYLASAKAVTGACLYVDHGMNIMGVAEQGISPTAH
jgi:enoyl-[acyl-carrier protein] reductase I